MKAITIQQPWAELIACGVKTVENRSWPTKHRGRIAIHAGMSRKHGYDDQLVYGAVIAIADLYDCVPVESAPVGPHAMGPWCWLLRDVHRIRPQFIRGSLGLWSVDLKAIPE